VLDERTQAPSKLRRQAARERGQAPHSAELTAAAGLLAASALLGVWGDDLALAMLGSLRVPLSGTPIVSADAAEVVGRLRELALGVAVPFLGMIAGVVVAAVAAHQAQVGLLWAPSLIAPDPSRLWGFGQGPGLITRAARGAWALAKTVVIVLVAAWAIRSDWAGFQRLGSLDTSSLARASGQALGSLAVILAVATLVLGLIDYGVQYRRFEARLRLTPEEEREDRRTTDGDPAVRARRRQIAKTWRGDSRELLAGASLVLTGPAGLTLVLAGGPPPRRVSIRTTAQGAPGARLRTAADAAKLPQVASPALARQLAGRQAPGLPLPAEILDQLAALWPSPRGPESAGTGSEVS